MSNGGHGTAGGCEFDLYGPQRLIGVAERLCLFAYIAFENGDELGSFEEFGVQPVLLELQPDLAEPGDLRLLGQMLVANEAVIRLLIGDDSLITGRAMGDLKIGEEFAGVCDPTHPLDLSGEVRTILPNFGQPDQPLPPSSQTSK
ncbi:hypothetical protein [Acetobacter syzygii]|uniref:hypothetical protein n=1 Tax=Acetobacter syzygii TaxID=146476 RepID=UPI001C2D1EBC